MNILVDNAAEPVLLFGPYRFHVRQRQVLRNGRPVPMGGRAMDILQVLLERAGTVVDKYCMIEQVWPDSVVEEVNLRVHIAALRRALGGGREGQRYIATVAQRGYSFIAPVTQAADSAWASDEVVVALHNLPACLTPLIGRHDEVAALLRQFPAQRLMTLAGPAGVGKTRLACRLAELLVGHFRDGVWLVDCSSADPAQVLGQLLRLLDIVPGEEPPLQVLGQALARRQSLLLFDSAECLPALGLQWIEPLLAQAPQLSVLVTSRQPLQLRGEWLHRVGGLQVPTRQQVRDPQQGLACAAVQLWIGRAQASLQGYALREQDLPVVGEICRQLDGLPLAIELIAAQLGTFALTDLQAQLLSGSWLLGLARRTAVARHQSLAAALDWDRARLTPSERLLLRRLAIFALDFTLEAASAVVCCQDYGPDALRNDLVHLQEKSLLVAVPDYGALRYRLLNTVRVHALVSLQASGEDRDLQVCYERYMGYPEGSAGSPARALSRA